MPTLDKMMFLYSEDVRLPTAGPVAAVRTIALSPTKGLALVQVISVFSGCWVDKSPNGTAWVRNEQLSTF